MKPDISKDISRNVFIILALKLSFSYNEHLIVHSVMVVNEFFTTATKFKYLEVTVPNQSHIYKEIKSRFNSGNQDYKIFGQCPSAGILTKTQKHNISKFGSISIIR
jgi:hypothetical protein